MHISIKTNFLSRVSDCSFATKHHGTIFHLNLSAATCISYFYHQQNFLLQSCAFANKTKYLIVRSHYKYHASLETNAILEKKMHQGFLYFLYSPLLVPFCILCSSRQHKNFLLRSHLRLTRQNVTPSTKKISQDKEPFFAIAQQKHFKMH